MTARKVYPVKFSENEIEIIEDKAKEKGLNRSEYIRASCLNQNECVGYNIMKPLCLMRKDLEEAKFVLGSKAGEMAVNDLIDKLERSCDLLWQYVNL